MVDLLAYVAGALVGGAAPDGLRGRLTGGVRIGLLLVASSAALLVTLTNAQLLSGDPSERFTGMVLLGFAVRGVVEVGRAVVSARQQPSAGHGRTAVDDASTG